MKREGPERYEVGCECSGLLDMFATKNAALEDAGIRAKTHKGVSVFDRLASKSRRARGNDFIAVSQGSAPHGPRESTDSALSRRDDTEMSREGLFDFAVGLSRSRVALRSLDDWLTTEPDPCRECPRCPECKRCLNHDACECWQERRDENV